MTDELGVPEWVEKLDEDEDAELEHVAMKILRCQSDRDAYAVLDHYVRSVRRRTYRRARTEEGG